MLKQQARLVAFTVFTLDLALVAAAFVLAHVGRARLLPLLSGHLVSGSFYPIDRYLPLLPAALAIWAAVLWSSGRYRSHRTVPLLAEATAVLKSSATASVLFLLAVWLFRLDQRLLDDDQLSRAWIFLFAGF